MRDSCKMLSLGCVGEIAILQKDKVIREKSFGYTDVDDLPKVVDKEPVVEKTPGERSAGDKFVDEMVKKFVAKTGADEKFVEETVKRIVEATDKFADSYAPYKWLGLDEGISPYQENLNFKEKPKSREDLMLKELSSDNVSFDEPIGRRNSLQKKRKLVQNESPEEPNQDQNSGLQDSRQKVLETREERYLKKTYCENDDKVVVYEFRNQNESVAETLAPASKPETVPALAPEKASMQVPSKLSQTTPLNPTSFQQQVASTNQQQQIAEALNPRRMLNKRTYDQIPPSPPPFQPQMSFASSAIQSPSAQTSSSPTIGRFSAAIAHARKVQQSWSEPSTSAESSESESDLKPFYPSW